MTQKRRKISNQIDVIRYFIEKMEIEMIDALLDINKTYQNFQKQKFIHKLKKVFETFSTYGDTHLFSVKGNCNSCDKSKTGFSFIGNKSYNYMILIFDTSDNKIDDLYECRNFRNTLLNETFKNRIYLDESNSISL